MSYSIWRFMTRGFTVTMDIETENDPDFSFDETGETARKVESGEWECFTAVCSVMWQGREVGLASLGNCIYADPRDFRDHIGMNARGNGSYFSDMVREAIGEARTELRRLKTAIPDMREAA